MFEAQKKQSEHTIAQKARELDAVKAERIRVDEATKECTQETKRRLATVMDWGATGDALLEFGALARELEELSCSLDGKRGKGLTVDPPNCPQEMEDCASEEVECLRAQVLEVKRSLQDVRSRSLAATTKSEVPATKPKRKKRAHK